MNAFASECTSGCESGWTLYLEQSFLSPTTAAAAAHRGSKQVDGRKSSSGFCDKVKIANKEERDHEEQEHDEEDLSMNNNFSFMPNNQASVESTLDYTQAATSSATHFELRSAYQDHYDSYIQSSPSGNQLQNNQLSGSKGNKMIGIKFLPLQIVAIEVNVKQQW
ncbi:hypothetical protein GH714_031268 [Hevea brasiliensis]|uniref:Uncharacterized protein n=1 Tax=Hevea brasiliensis TaxID=3981 RepID=A0A6A6N8G1_HEVBR|nr:hypothetical protein GH714_031268 [Hevea brasiliensis]